MGNWGIKSQLKCACSIKIHFSIKWSDAEYLAVIAVANEKETNTFRTSSRHSASQDLREYTRPHSTPVGRSSAVAPGRGRNLVIS